MSLKFFLRLVIVLCIAVSDCFGVGSATEGNGLAETNNTPVFTVKSNWMSAKATLYRTMGDPIKVDARTEIVNLGNGADEKIMAFMDPGTGNAWIGENNCNESCNTGFYLETDSGIVFGSIDCGSLTYGVSKNTNEFPIPTSAYVQVLWIGSFIDKIARGENLQTLVDRFNAEDYQKWRANAWSQTRITVLGRSPGSVEYGLDPWLFVDGNPTFKAIEVREGKVRLELESSKGDASVWMDPQTWQLVNAVESKNYEFKNPLMFQGFDRVFKGSMIQSPDSFISCINVSPFQGLID